MKNFLFYIIMLLLGIIFLQLGFPELDIKKGLSILLVIQFVSVGVCVLFKDKNEK